MRGTALALFFRHTYTNFLMNPLVRMFVLLSFFCYIAVAAWGCTKIQVGLDPMDLLPRDSFARNSLQLYEEYFSAYSGFLHVTMTDLTRLNYDFPFWLEMERELRHFENTTFTEFSDSWLRLFLAFTKTQNFHITPDNFIPVLIRDFLSNPTYARYK